MNRNESKSKEGMVDIRIIGAILLLGIFFWSLWTESVEYSSVDGVTNQWDGFMACWVFVAMVYVLYRIVKFIRSL